MPGLYRSPGLADIDVCAGKRQAGSEALIRTRKRYQEENEQLTELMERPRRSVTLPLSGDYGEGGMYEHDCGEDGREDREHAQDVETSDGSMHEGYGERRVEETGMPPTPPDAATNDEPQEPSPLFADGVRNALSSQKSGALSTTPVNPQLSPPTPDTTPPARPENIRPSSPLKQRAEDNGPRHTRPSLRAFADSQAEFFQTAQEVPLASTETRDDQVVLPENDTLPQHWLDNSHELIDVGVEDNGVVNPVDYPTSGAIDGTSRRTSPHSPRPRYRFESPQIEREETDWDKHISYVSGPDELDYAAGIDSNMAEQQEESSQPLNGLGVTGVDIEEKQRSVENINNSVYKHIQEENIRRESVMSGNSSAVRAGIVVPSAGSTPKSVRRCAKRGSLRGEPENNDTRDDGGSNGHVLKQEKRHLPSRDIFQGSPIVVAKTRRDPPSSNATREMRQLSSPARLEPSDDQKDLMARFSRLRASGTLVTDSGSEHTLKRQTHADRLARNMTVRRSSLEVSPTDLEEAFERIDKGAASVRKQRFATQPQRVGVDVYHRSTPKSRQQAVMNQAVKRSKPFDAQETESRKFINLNEFNDPDTADKYTPAAIAPPWADSPRRVRRFSREERLENNDQLRRSSVGNTAEPSTHHSSESKVKRTSTDPSLLYSPRTRSSMDARFLHPTTTPMSTSAFSDRTADIEVGEASGVRIYPHNNNSLLVVQQGSRPVSKDKNNPNPTDGPTLADIAYEELPIFAAQVDPPTPILGMSKPEAHVDSPLTNPRAAPAPPILNFIPPTPIQEHERQLGEEDEATPIPPAKASMPGRSLSFKQRARRFSDSFFGRSTSYRKSKPHDPPPRDNFLSPMWRPQRFWDDDYSSDDDYYDDEDNTYESDLLPPGGDTSNVVDDNDTARAKRGVFPRTMSKRLPGFRGAGGFLQGNSLGIDRHGTNARRHYVSTVSRRASSEKLNERPGMPTRQLSQDSALSTRSKSFKVPFTSGMRAKWVGTQAFRAKMRERKVQKAEREREKRREELKGRIGMRVYHG